MNSKNFYKTAPRQDAIEHEGVTITYFYCHSRRRTLGMTVSPDKSVTVRVPLRTPLAEIRMFVSSRAGWILKVRKKFELAIPRPLQSYSEGAVFSYLGEEYRLKIEVGKPKAVSIRVDRLVVTSPDGLDEEQVHQLLDAWYRKKAFEIFKTRALECQQRLQAEGIPLPPIVIRPMKSRWGSYSYRTRRINLNLNLIKAPLACLDYVIIHELCHVKVRHHGPDFWKLVARYVPDYLELRKELRFIG